MTTEENKTIVRRYLEEGWQEGNLKALADIVDSNVVDHALAVFRVALPNQAQGLEGKRQNVQMFHSAFKDVRINIDYIVADGDRVADRWTMTGVHKGEFMGIPATGKSVSITGTDIARLAGGKIIELWHVEDAFGLMQQLGVIPAATGRSAGKDASTNPPLRAGDARRPGFQPPV